MPWMSKKQLIVTLSTYEAKYVATTSSIFHAIWLRNLLKELGLSQEEPPEIFIDNKSVIALTKNCIFHDRNKAYWHSLPFHTRVHWDKNIQIKYVKLQDQVVDIFTKPLKQEDFFRLRNLLGVTRSSLSRVLGHKFDP